MSFLRSNRLFKHPLRSGSDKHRQAVAFDRRASDTTATQTEAQPALVAVAERWDKQYPTLSKAWSAHGNRMMPFLACLPDSRKASNTTNALEALKLTRRKVLSHHRSCPTDEAAMQVID